MHNSDDDHASDAKRRSYEVGHGKPPAHTRFKPGQSGNPSGRPKGRRNLCDLVVTSLSKKVRMREGDRARNVTIDEALVQLTIKAALNGDYRARRDLFALKRDFEQQQRIKDQSSDPILKLSEDDQAIIDDFFKRRTGGSDHNGR